MKREGQAPGPQYRRGSQVVRGPALVNSQGRRGARTMWAQVDRSVFRIPG